MIDGILIRDLARNSGLAEAELRVPHPAHWNQQRDQDLATPSGIHRRQLMGDQTNSGLF